MGNSRHHLHRNCQQQTSAPNKDGIGLYQGGGEASVPPILVPCFHSGLAAEGWEPREAAQVPFFKAALRPDMNLMSETERVISQTLPQHCVWCVPSDLKQLICIISGLYFMLAQIKHSDFASAKQQIHWPRADFFTTYCFSP